MSTPFEAWFNEQFPQPDDAHGTGAELSAEFTTLCEQQQMPVEAMLRFMELVTDVLRPLARLRTCADWCEAEGHVEPGFTAALLTLIQRHVTEA